MHSPHPNGQRTTAAERLFANGGEMGTRMAATDWAATPLGPVAHWPPSLRTSVRICLTSRHPILLWWGDDLTMLYNDAYRPILGGKHPHALGQAGHMVWPEIWDIIGPMLAGVRTTGLATWSDNQMLLLERHGFAEECYFTFSYSPIEDERGTVGGVFTAVTETTEHVLAERRAHRAQALAGGLVEAHTTKSIARAALATLAAAPNDLPFSVLYRVEHDAQTLTWLGGYGIAAASPLAPPTMMLADLTPLPMPSDGTPGVVNDLAWLADSFTGEVALTPHTALVLPIVEPGHTIPTLVWVAGLSPRLPRDAAYHTWLTTLSGQMATALVAAHAYEAERQRAEDLAALDRAKTVFFSNISHEFRTPLTLMLGPLADALADTAHPLPPAQRERLDLIGQSNQRLLRLVNTLLDFARLEAGRMTATFVPTDLAQLTTDLASTFRSLVERVGLTLVIDCPPLPQPVYVDRDQWEQIVLNLLSNAFKFTFTGQITVRLRATGNEVTLQVADTGVGIPPDEVGRVFERFHRVAGVRGRSLEGSGIGLALVQELVALHGGTLGVISTVGQGTTFTLTVSLGTAHLPPERVQAAAPPAALAQGAAGYVAEAERWLPSGAAALLPDLPRSGTTPSGQVGAHLLVADDNADMRAYLTRLLGERYRITTVATGVDALAVIAADPPDLVLSDVMMPDLDGYGVLHTLRADPQTATIPVILLSARAGDEATLEGLAAGADDYLAKPFTAREVLVRVAARLEIAQTRRDADQRAQQLSAVIAAIPDALAVYDPDGHIVLANAPFHAQVARFGGAGATYHERAQQTRPRDEADVPLALAALPQTRVLAGEAITGQQPVGMRLTDDTGQVVTLSVTGGPIRDGAGAIVGGVIVNRDVTEQRHQEAAVRERARQLEALFAAVADGLVIYDTQGHLVEWNAALATLFEFDQQPDYASLPLEVRPAHLDVRDTAGQPVSPATYPFMRALGGEVVAGSAAMDLLITLPRGRQLAVSVSAAPLRDAEGAIVGAIASYRDVTEQRRLTQAAQDHATQLQTILNLLPVGVSLVDAAGKAVLVNQATRTIWGDDLPLVNQRADYDHYPAWWTATGQRVAAEEWGVVRSLTKGAVAVADELTIQAFDGRRKTILNSTAPLRDGAGAITGAMSVIVDITERQHIEARTRVTLRALLDLVRLLVRTPTEGTGQEPALIATLMDLARDVVGSAYASLLRLDEARDILIPVATNRPPEAAHAWLTGLATAPMSVYVDHTDRVELHAGRVIRKQVTPGGPFPTAPLWLGVPLMQGTTLLGMLSFSYTDPDHVITQAEGEIALDFAHMATLVLDRARLLDERATAQAEILALQEAYRLMNEFLGIAGHELRTPLTSITANVQLSERGLGRLLAAGVDVPVADLARYELLAQRTVRQVGRLDRLVSDLLDVSRITVGKLDLHTEPGDLGVVVREAVETLRVAWPERTITLDLPRRGSLMVLLDADRIGQVVLNLLSNALKYSPPATEVYVTVTRERTELRVSVIDQGPGITADQQVRLFERFYRVPGIEQQSGSGVGLGLGLYISHTIIARHERKLDLMSTPGQGTTFFFTLPVSAPRRDAP